AWFAIEECTPVRIEAQYVESVEDGCRVPQHVPRGFEIGRALKVVGQVNGSLHHFRVAQLASNNEKFEVKSKALDCQQRHDFLQHLPAEELEPGLCITDL